MYQSIEKKRLEEQKIVQEMIYLYCKKKHGRRKQEGLCKACETLLQYANERVRKCPFMENKTFCSACRVHCYQPEMREKIREVMKFSGPRMLLYHPAMAMRHMITTMQAKRKE